MKRIATKAEYTRKIKNLYNEIMAVWKSYEEEMAPHGIEFVYDGAATPREWLVMMDIFEVSKISKKDKLGDLIQKWKHLQNLYEELLEWMEWRRFLIQEKNNPMPTVEEVLKDILGGDQ